MINQEANVKQAQWPKSGCFTRNGAWKPAMAGIRSLPATISVGAVSPSRSEQFSQAGCPFVSGHNGGSCTLALAAGRRLTTVVWGASGAQLVTSPSLLRTKLQGQSGRSRQGTWPSPPVSSEWGQASASFQTDCWPAGCPASAFSPSPSLFTFSFSLWHTSVFFQIVSSLPDLGIYLDHTAASNESG